MCVFVCVSVWERERERERVCVCVCECVWWLKSLQNNFLSLFLNFWTVGNHRWHSGAPWIGFLSSRSQCGLVLSKKKNNNGFHPAPTPRPSISPNVAKWTSCNQICQWCTITSWSVVTILDCCPRANGQGHREGYSPQGLRAFGRYPRFWTS